MNKKVLFAVGALVLALVLAVGMVLGLTLLADPLVEQGVTNFDSITLSDDLIVGDDLTVSGSAQFGTSSLYPLGFASDGNQIVYGSDTVTTTATASHGLTTVTWALCSLGEDAGTGAGAAATCTVTVSGNTVTLSTFQDDAVTSTVGAVVNWLVIGAP